MTIRQTGALCLIVLLVCFSACRSKEELARTRPTLNVAISPYQDIAMIVNVHNLGLEEKYELNVKLHTMAWEDILPAVASAGETVDLGFGSYVEFLTKQDALNPSGGDPVVFIYPAYIFKGGSFITFDPSVPTLTRGDATNPSAARKFLSFRIGAQKESIYEMMLFSLARRAGVDPKRLRIIDTPLNDGILATQRGSLDVASAGLTQISEARSRGGRVVLTMEDLGFADITGFICKKSILEKKRGQIEKLLRMWFESVDFVMMDLDRNSSASLEYLRKNAATQYTLDQYKRAIGQEYFPRSVGEANREILSDGGKFSYRRIGEDIAEYRRIRGQERPPLPQFLTLHER